MDDEPRPGGFRAGQDRDPWSRAEPGPGDSAPIPGGQPSYGGPTGPAGQPPVGRPAYGQPWYGESPYGQLQHGGPTGPTGRPPYGPTGSYGPTDYLSSDPAVLSGRPSPRRTRGRGLWAGIAAATAVALTAGGFYAYTALAGGGVALAARLPADVVGYAELNLDPPAAQKVAAIRFFRHFPNVKVGSDEGSLVDSLLEPLLSDSSDRRKFTESIKPWLGNHAAMGVDPQRDTVEAVLVVETTDAAKTRAGLDRLNAEELDAENKIAYVIDGDVVTVADRQEIAETAAKDASASSLETNETFKSDLEQVGAEDGVMVGWSDLAKASRYEGDATSLQARGRVAGRLTFTDTTADLVVRTFGVPAQPRPELVGPKLARLPDDTAAAFAISGADELVRKAYAQAETAGLGDQLRDAQESTGLDLPEDVAALVGSSTVIAVRGTEGEPKIGAICNTSDPERARRAADRLLVKIDEPMSGLTVSSTAAGTVLASSSAYADRLASPGNLGEQEQVRAVLPELDKAQAALYVDIRKAAALAGESLPESSRALRAFGLTSSGSGDTSTLRLRLLVG